MAYVHVTTTNLSDQKAAFLLDDEQDAEQIEYFQKLKRRDELKDVEVSKPSATKAPTK